MSTDPEEVRQRAEDATTQAREQLSRARRGVAGAVVRASKSKWLLDGNHLSELFAQALGLQK